MLAAAQSMGGMGGGPAQVSLTLRASLFYTYLRRIRVILNSHLPVKRDSAPVLGPVDGAQDRFGHQLWDRSSHKQAILHLRRSNGP